MIEKIKQFGGLVLHPCQFQGLNYRNGKLSSVQTSLGELEADQAVFACGIDTDNLLSINSITTPKPGVIVRTTPSEKRLNKIIVGPGVHVHQQLDGRVIFGEQAGAPNSHLERLKDRPKDFPSGLFTKQHVDRMLKMATTFINNLDNLEVEKASIGWRPLPRDGKPVIGRLNKVPSVYVAVMHSGVSLAAIVGKLATQEILDGSTNIILQDFRPSRFN
jgi:glycine/D-amino acid oxidase-like deaminating enzyme